MQTNISVHINYMGLYSENFIIKTDIDKEEAVSILRDNTDEDGKLFRNIFNFTKPFRGEISSSGFKIVPNISYRNSWLPVIIGDFLETSGKTTVNIKMRVAVPVTIFMVFWYVLTGIGTILMWSYELLKETPILLFFFLFMAILSQVAFRMELRKRKKQLSLIFRESIE